MLAQLIACNRLHRVEQRCARWLLMTVRPHRAPAFPMTQERLEHDARRTAADGHGRDGVAARRRVRREQPRPGSDHRPKAPRILACECYALCAGYFDFVTLPNGYGSASPIVGKSDCKPLSANKGGKHGRTTLGDNRDSVLFLVLGFLLHFGGGLIHSASGRVY